MFSLRQATDHHAAPAAQQLQSPAPLARTVPAGHADQRRGRPRRIHQRAKNVAEESSADRAPPAKLSGEGDVLERRMKIRCEKKGEILFLQLLRRFRRGKGSPCHHRALRCYPRCRRKTSRRDCHAWRLTTPAAAQRIRLWWEILNVLRRSPPVPTMSRISRDPRQFCSMGSGTDFSRSCQQNAAISSGVSPFCASAMRKSALVCAGDRFVRHVFDREVESARWTDFSRRQVCFVEGFQPGAIFTGAKRKRTN